MENSTPFTHRVAREFVSGDFVHHVGDLVSDADWTHQGKQYVESMKWVVPLAEHEIAALAAAEIEKEVPVVLEEAIEVVQEVVPPKPKPTPAKKTAKPAVKKTVAE